MRPDVHQAAAEGNITWITPQTNDTLQAGQNYTAKWNAASTPNSPIFQLCRGVEQGSEPTKGTCGAWVNVPVQQVNGSYFVSLTLPNVSSTDPFVLRMHDDPNPEVVSPSFFIHPASPSNNTSSSVGDILSSAGALGLSFQLPHQSNLTNDPLVVLMPSYTSHVPRAKRDFQVPDILHPTPMFIAFSVIPIVLLVGALVTFVVIWVRQRRNGQLKKLYLTEHPVIYPRRPVPKSLASNEDLEDAVQTLAYERFRSEKVSSSTSDEKEGSMSRIAESRVRRRELRDEEEGWALVPAVPREIQPRRAHRHPVPVSSHPDPGNQFDMSDYTQRPRSYAPEPRNLTASYFPPVLPPFDLSSDTAPEDIRGAGAAIALSEGLDYASLIQEFRHADGADLDNYGHGVRLVESPMAMQSRMCSTPMPMGMTPPPPSVTKLSERLHLRRRSESRSGSPSRRSGEVPTVLGAKTRYLEREKMEEADLKDLR